MGEGKFTRRALVLGGLIVVLAGTYVLGLVFSPARVEKRRAAQPLVEGLKTEAVAELRITGPEGTMELSKKAGGWVLPLGGRDYPGSASRVQVLLDFLKEVKRIRVATENPELWKDFGVGKDATRRLELRDQSGSSLLQLFIGNQEMSLSGDYVRVEGSNEVLLSDRSFAYYTGTDPRFWSDLRILPEALKGQDIVRFSLDTRAVFGEQGAGGAARYTLLLEDGKAGAWKVEGQPGASLDAGEIEKLLNAVAGMEANEFAVGVSAKEAGLEKPRAQIVISTSGGQDHRLRVGAEAGERQHYLAREGSDYVYRVAEWRLQAVVKALEDLAPKSAQ